MGVRLLLLHPQLAMVRCASCQQWLYDDRHRLVIRGGEAIRRPAGSSTPCWQCPKRSPREAQGYERDLDRISRTLDLYFRVRATSGRCLGDREAADPLLSRHLTIIDTLVRRRNQTQRAVGK